MGSAIRNSWKEGTIPGIEGKMRIPRTKTVTNHARKARSRSDCFTSDFHQISNNPSNAAPALHEYSTLATVVLPDRAAHQTPQHAPCTVGKTPEQGLAFGLVPALKDIHAPGPSMRRDTRRMWRHAAPAQ